MTFVYYKTNEFLMVISFIPHFYFCYIFYVTNILCKTLYILCQIYLINYKLFFIL